MTAASAVYDYIMLDAGEGPSGAAQRRLAGQVSSVRAVLAEHDGEVVGLFTPQLGWSARQAALLARWRGGTPGRGVLQQALGGASIGSGACETLKPTLRPQGNAPPAAGGIYVHRWFTVKHDDLAEFVELSGQGWPDFEQRFDTTIFGLMTAERSSADIERGVTRLLLLTRYGNHGVWEASRDPSTAAMQIFIRRQTLTLETSACSTLLADV